MAQTEKSPPTHILFVGAFVFKDKKILLGKRSETEGHLPGYWAVPGGKVEYHKDYWNILEKTAMDEVLEETGVTISDAANVFCNNSFVRTDGQQVVAINLLCEYVSGDLQPLEDTVAVGWFGIEELEDMLIENNCRKQIELAFSLQ